MITCPECGSGDIDRIGVYEYSCNICGASFDANEAGGTDDNWYPDDDE